jgi:hypothetical protein
MTTESATALIMGLSALLLLAIGVWLLRRYEKEVGYNSIGHPFPMAEFLYESGTLLLISGGFLLIFALAVLFL